MIFPGPVGSGAETTAGVADGGAGGLPAAAIAGAGNGALFTGGGFAEGLGVGGGNEGAREGGATFAFGALLGDGIETEDGDRCPPEPPPPMPG